MSEGHPNRPIIDVVKRGKRPNEEFDPTKLHHSIMATCLSIRTPEGQADDIAKSVTLGVMSWCETRPEITTNDIRHRAAQLLQKLHTDAAFVYQHHKTIM